MLKNFKVNLLLNASVDLPLVEVPSGSSLTVEVLRVPITDREPETATLYLSEVADKIYENYNQNGQTVIYCHDGCHNSIVLAVGK